MARLQAFPQTEREAQQIHTIAFIILHLGERSESVDGDVRAKLFLPKESILEFSGKGVALYLEEGEDGDTLIVNTYDPPEPVIIEESE